MQNYVNGPEIPLGLGMALAQDPDAMRYFANQSRARKREIIAGAHAVSSKEAMRKYVRDLVSEG
ncbi:MAG: YdeI/OmpD-associated family protein [Intestinimonas sp.]|nr:YdeI/OmpD-associated family protein [Intestinimonas sp.]